MYYLKIGMENSWRKDINKQNDEFFFVLIIFY